MTTFYLIRHAERSGDQSLLTGTLDSVHLTEPGKRQAERLARHLARDPIHRIITSPLERARETAEPLARIKQLEPSVSPALGEVEIGEWTGRTFGELERIERWRQFNHFRSATLPPRGETMLQVQARFVCEMLRLRDAHPGESIALVSHADPIRAALLCFLGMPIDFFDRLEVSLASVSVLMLDPWQARLVRLNDVPHQPG